MAFVKPFDYIDKGKLYTMLMDGRETGKTTGTIKGCIERFLQTNGQYTTAWVRRWKSDTQDAKRGFFAKIIENDWFPDHKFSVKNNIGYIDDTPAFYFLTLSVNARTRGGGIPNLKLMVFDEFLIDPRISRYIGKDEPAIFDSLFDTYARPRTASPDNRAQALFLANTFTTINPYFLYHNIKFNKNQKVFQNKFIYAEKLHTIVNREPSEWELFTSGKSYGDHANDAKFILDDNSMIRKLPAKTQPLFIFLFNGKLGVRGETPETEKFTSARNTTKTSNRVSIFQEKTEHQPCSILERSSVGTFTTWLRFVNLWGLYGTPVWKPNMYGTRFHNTLI